MTSTAALQDDTAYAMQHQGSQDQALNQTLGTSFIIAEEGVVKGRNKLKRNIPEEDAADINGPENDKGQYIWDGTYVVTLRRGITLSPVYAVAALGRGAQNQRVIPVGEVVTIQWLSKGDVYVPVIIEGNTMEYGNKQLTGKADLLDFGEQVLRSAIAYEPEVMADGSRTHPFSDNQFDSPESAPDADGAFDENSSKVVKNPGGTVFVDKFGRVTMLCRHPNHEFLVTMGKVDTGQDDVSALESVSEQDAYYDSISNDESDPDGLHPTEPFAPKPLNLSQYQLREKSYAIENDPDPKRRVPVGILPRFDKWIFTPVVIRSYSADTDGQVVSGTINSVYQMRGQSAGDEYGYMHTITQRGDVKEFVARHLNQRIVGDCLQSIGGNHEIKLKTSDRNDDGSSNPNNAVHIERLSSGVVRLRTNETSATESRFDFKVSANGNVDLAIDNGRNSSDPKLSLTINASTGEITLTSKGTVNVDGAIVNLGSNATKQLCNNLPACLFTGAPHSPGNTNVKA